MATIPPPSSNSLDLGPLTFNYYGIMIALGVLAAVELSRRRLNQAGGNPDHIMQLTMRAVPAGLVGARLYHVITDWKTYIDQPLAALQIWNGGLGIPGGLAAGVIAGLWYARKQGWAIPAIVAATIPAIPVAQAIGRVGNWFNQEIVGKPSQLPWALEVDPAFRPEPFAVESTFHPTFLYEAVLNLAIAAILVVVDRRGSSKPIQLLPLWVALYGAARFAVEAMRTDHASVIAGIRVNHWVSVAAVIIGIAWSSLLRSRRSGLVRST